MSTKLRDAVNIRTHKENFPSATEYSNYAQHYRYLPNSPQLKFATLSILIILSFIVPIFYRLSFLNRCRSWGSFNEIFNLSLIDKVARLETEAFPLAASFLSPRISQICDTRINIRERDSNGINSFQSQCLTSALTSFIRFAEQKWIRASCSACQRDPSGTLSPGLGPKSSSPGRSARGKFPLARKLLLTNIFPFTPLSFAARFQRNIFIASLNNPYPLQRRRAPSHTRRIIVISDKLYFDKRVSLPTGEFRARSRATDGFAANRPELSKQVKLRDRLPLARVRATHVARRPFFRPLDENSLKLVGSGVEGEEIRMPFGWTPANLN